MVNIDNIVTKFRERAVKAKEIFEIREISKEAAYDFIRQYHYLGDAKFFSMYNYGLFLLGTNELMGCATYSLPQGTETLKSWFGLECDDTSIMELSRLCMLPQFNGTNATSYLLGNSVKMLRSHNVRAVITLADSSRHVGSIYQVCNFKYYGTTKSAKDFYRDDGQINPRGKTGSMHGVYLPRTQKHRYAYILDNKLKCLYEECEKPTLNKKTTTSCCQDNYIVYDNRYDEWYTCPRCCSDIVKISHDEAQQVMSATNKKEIVDRIIKRWRKDTVQVEDVALF